MPQNRSIAGDIIRPRPRRTVAPARAAIKPELSKVPKKASRLRLSWLREGPQYLLLAIISLGAAYSPVWGQGFLAAYAVFALIFRRPSRLTFGMAVFTLATIPLFEGIKQSGIAQNAAIYAFEFLVLGIVQALWEQLKFAKTHN